MARRQLGGDTMSSNLIPDGIYDVIVSDTEVPSASDWGQGFKLEFQITGPTHIGKKLFPFYCITHSGSEDAVNMAWGALTKIAYATDAVGTFDMDDETGEVFNPESVCGKPLKIKVGVAKKEFNGEKQNEIKDYFYEDGAKIVKKDSESKAPNVGVAAVKAVESIESPQPATEESPF